MRLLRQVPLLAAFAALIVALTSCGAERSSGLDGPVMRHLAPFANEGEGAEIRGVIEIEGDCLYVSLDEVGERHPVVWPALTAWDADARRVLLPNGESVGHGDSVYGGGGYRYAADVAAIAGDSAGTLASECVDNQYGEIAVVNNQPDAISAGVGVVSTDEPTISSVDESSVEGDWLVTDLIVEGERFQIDSSQPMTVTIEGSDIRGSAGCNQYSGAIDWSADAGFGRFVVSGLSWTEMACEAGVMEIEQAFLVALQSVDSYEQADGLYVARSGAATNFRLVSAVPGD